MVYAWGQYRLYGIDAKTGQIAWSSYLGEQVSSIVVSDETVYVTAYAVAGYDLFEFTLDGFLLEETFIWGTPSLSPAAVVEQEIYTGASNAPYNENHDVQNSSGFTYDLLAFPGTFQWQYPISVEVSPTVVDGVVYAGSTDNNVYALNATTGSLLWRYATQSTIDNPLAVAYGAVFVSSSDGNLYALDVKTGTLLWKAAGMSSPAVANGVVYVSSTNCSISALEAKTGAVLGTANAPGSTDLCWPVVANGILYVPSDLGLTAFGLPGQTPSRAAQ